jgi:hypothetical protein
VPGRPEPSRPASPSSSPRPDPTRIPGGPGLPEALGRRPVPTPSAGSREQAAPPRTADELPPGYRRSLAYSGLFGLVISVVGLAMIGRRRRLW